MMPRSHTRKRKRQLKRQLKRRTVPTPAEPEVADQPTWKPTPTMASGRDPRGRWAPAPGGGAPAAQTSSHDHRHLGPRSRTAPVHRDEEMGPS